MVSESAKVPSASAASKGDLDFREEVLACTDCRLRQKGAKLVLGRGDPGAPLMFVGEAPGVQEEKKGEPFVGRSGKVLARMLRKIGIDLSRVYLTNVLKYRPPANRAPRASEIRACTAHLVREIELVKPKVICALGGVAARAVLGARGPLNSLRGKIANVHGVRVFSTFHPSYVRWSKQIQRKFEADLRKVCSDAGLLE